MFIYTVQINTCALQWSWEDVNTYITELQVTAADVDNETLVQKN
jgi:hypothetical protein